MAFKMHKIIFLPEKNVCLPYLIFSGLLPGTPLLFLFGLLLLLLLLLLLIIIMKKTIFEAMIFWIMDKIHVAEHLRNGKQTFLLLCFSWLFHAKKTLYSPR